MNENARISINISLKFVPKGLINNIPALVQIMAWRRPGDKPLSEPMMVNLLTHICVTRPQWVNTLKPGQNGRRFTDDIFTCIFMNEKFCILIQISLKFVVKGPVDNMPALVQIMAWRLFGAKPLSEPMMTHIAITRSQGVDTMSATRKERHFADNIFKRIFLRSISFWFTNSMNVCSLEVVWNRPGDMPLPKLSLIWFANVHYIHHYASMMCRLIV